MDTEFSDKISMLWSKFALEVTVDERFIRMMEMRDALTRCSAMDLIDCKRESERCMQFLNRMQMGDPEVCKPALIQTLIDFEYETVAMAFDPDMTTNYLKMRTVNATGVDLDTLLS